jgi:beta-lactamase regulating signal transducer with metallopeptidase domain/tetratricopeptide (TPR) repeat protein
MWSWILENTLVSSALAVVVAIACRCLRSRPAVCHFLWLLVLVRLVCPPLHVAAWPPEGVRRFARKLGGDVAAWVSPRVTPAEPAPAPRFEDAGDRLARVAPQTIDEALEVSSPTKPSGSWGDGAFFEGARPAISRRGRGVPPGFERRFVEPEPVARGPLPPPDSRPVQEDGAAGLAWAWSDDVGWLLLAIWLAGSIVVLVRQFARTTAFSQTARIARRAPLELLRLVDDVAMQLGIRAPEVRVVRRLASPVVWSLGRPILLWPDPRGRDVGDDGTRGIVAHELAHVRRHDHWVAWFEMAAMIVLWWHPLFWIARRELRDHAELACDAWATSLQPERRRVYAEALIDVVNRMSSKPLVPPALGASDVDFRNVERRLRMILHRGVSSRVSPLAGIATTLVAMLALPSWSGADPRPDLPGDACAKASADACAVPCAGEPRPLVADDAQPAPLPSAIPAPPPPDDDDASVEARANAAYRDGDFRAAAELYAKAAGTSATPVNALYNAGCCRARLGDDDAAFEWLGKAIDAGWRDAAHMKGDSDLESLRDDPRFGELVSRIERARKNASKAERSKQKPPKSPAAARAQAAPFAPPPDAADEARGMERYRQGDFRAAAEIFERQAQRGDSPMRALYNAACCYGRLGDADAALETLGRATDAGWSDADHARADDDLASLRGNPRFEEALARMARGARASAEPATPQTKEKKVERKKRETSTRSETTVAEPAQSGSDEARGFERYNAGDYGAAAEFFEKQAAGGETPERAWYNLACCRARQGDADRAIEALAKAIDAGWTDADKLRQDADLASIQGDPRLARVVGRIEDRSVLAQFGATTWEELRDRSRREVEDDPENGAAWHHLGWAALRLDDYDEAERAFERQEKLGFVRKNARYNLACTYARMGARDRAFEWLEKSVAAGMSDVEHVRRDPDLAELRDDPRFAEFLAKMADGSAAREAKEKTKTKPAKSSTAKPRRQEV